MISVFSAVLLVSITVILTAIATWGICSLYMSHKDGRTMMVIVADFNGVRKKMMRAGVDVMLIDNSVIGRIAATSRRMWGEE